MSATPRSEQQIQSLLTKGSWVVLGILVLLSLLFATPIFAVSVAVGGLLAILNLYWLRNTLRRVLAEQPAASNRYVQVRYLLRFSLLALALYALLKTGVDVFGLVLGLSVLVINIIILAIYFAMTQQKGG